MAAITKTRRQLSLETLETRLALSAMVQNGNLYIHGTNANDVVTVHQVSSYGIGAVTVTENGVEKSFATAGLWGGKVFFSGYRGNDFFRADVTLEVQAFGQDGNDTLVGGSGNDYLHGGNGLDSIYGQAGRDTLVAGDDYSTNYMYGGEGNDSIVGGWGNDLLDGQAGNDLLQGGWGHDRLIGGAGADSLYGGEGNDVLDGGKDAMRDYLNGGAGSDHFQRDLVWTATGWKNSDTPADGTSNDWLIG